MSIITVENKIRLLNKYLLSLEILHYNIENTQKIRVTIEV